MRSGQIVLVLVIIALLCISGCKSVNLGGTGQVGSVTGSGQVSIPVFRADDQASNEE